jgi:hypothetical protein
MKQARLWDQNKIWEKVMPVGYEPDEVQTFKKRFKELLRFIYGKGSVSGKNLIIKYVKYNNTNGFYKGEYDTSEEEIDMEEYSFDITKNYTTRGTAFDRVNLVFDAFVVRYKTGYQLSSNLIFNPSATDSIPGVTTVHRFNAYQNTQNVDNNNDNN